MLQSPLCHCRHYCQSLQIATLQTASTPVLVCSDGIVENCGGNKARSESVWQRSVRWQDVKADCPSSCPVTELPEQQQRGKVDGGFCSSINRKARGHKRDNLAVTASGRLEVGLFHNWHILPRGCPGLCQQQDRSQSRTFASYRCRYTALSASSPASVHLGARLGSIAPAVTVRSTELQERVDHILTDSNASKLGGILRCMGSCMGAMR